MDINTNIAGKLKIETTATYVSRWEAIRREYNADSEHKWKLEVGDDLPYLTWPYQVNSWPVLPDFHALLSKILKVVPGSYIVPAHNLEYYSGTGLHHVVQEPKGVNYARVSVGTPPSGLSRTIIKAALAVAVPEDIPMIKAVAICCNSSPYPIAMVSHTVEEYWTDIYEETEALQSTHVKYVHPDTYTLFSPRIISKGRRYGGASGSIHPARILSTYRKVAIPIRGEELGNVAFTELMNKTSSPSNVSTWSLSQRRDKVKEVVDAVVVRKMLGVLERIPEMFTVEEHESIYEYMAAIKEYREMVDYATDFNLLYVKEIEGAIHTRFVRTTHNPRSTTDHTYTNFDALPKIVQENITLLQMRNEEQALIPEVGVMYAEGFMVLVPPNFTQ